MQSKGHYVEALKFYEPLLKTDAHLSSDVYTQMGMCYQKLNLVTEAQHCYQTVVQNDETNIDARVQLARIYEAQGLPEQAFVYVNEVLALDRQGIGQRRRRRRRTESGPVEPAPADTFLPVAVRKPSIRKRKSIRPDPEQAREAERIQDDASKMQFIRLQALEERMESGDEEATSQWMEAASVLINDFRSAKVFYPPEKYMKFLGYSREARMRAYKSQNSVVADMQAMGDRLQATLGTLAFFDSIEQQEDLRCVEEALAAAEESEPVPTNFRGIEFVDWLDIFLKYALCLARQGDRAGAYEMLNAADDANVFHDDKQSMFLIHVCWAGNTPRFLTCLY